MRNYNKALLIVAILIVGSGVGFFVYGFTTAGSIKKSFNFSYEPSSPDPVEDITINVDIGKIIFMYNTSPTTSYAEIDVYIGVSGLFVEGKTYQNFFHPSNEWWDNTTATLNLLTLPGMWFDPSHWFKSYNISLTVTLRTDIVYDITALASTGSIEMEVPNNANLEKLSLTSSTGSINLKTLGDNKITQLTQLETSTGSIAAYLTRTNFTSGFQATTSTGSVTLNFTNCIMGGNLKGKTSTGSVNYKSYNMFYLNDILLNLETSTGSINVELYQYISMGANVTGTWETSTGSVNVLYRDTLVDTDVRFIGSKGTGSFNYEVDPTMIITGLHNNIYSTVNFGEATYSYVFSLDTSTGNINADAQSS